LDRRQVFLLAAHFSSRETLGLFARLQAQTAGLGDSFILYHRRSGRPVPRAVLRRPHYVVDDDRLEKLGYYEPSFSLIPGRTHFPLLCFRQDHPYLFYWFIEYDVRFRGAWGDLFRHFEDSNEDLLTCHLRRYADEPAWSWWSSMSHENETIPPRDYVRSFNTVCRFSGRALEHVDQMHQAGWRGHQEVLVPTLLQRDGFRIRDLGGRGEFVAPGDRDRFYLDATDPHLADGTMRYRPPHVFLSRVPKGRLAHPVKTHRVIRCLAERLPIPVRRALSPTAIQRRLAALARYRHL